MLCHESGDFCEEGSEWIRVVLGDKSLQSGSLFLCHDVDVACAPSQQAQRQSIFAWSVLAMVAR